MVNHTNKVVQEALKLEASAINMETVVDNRQPASGSDMEDETWFKSETATGMTRPRVVPESNSGNI